jgi:hypothetical protein
MATFIGSDCTKGALEWQFRRYKAGAKLQIAAVKAGQDPKNINVDVNPQGKPDGKASSGGNCTLYSFLFFSFLATQHSTTQVHGSTHIDYFLELAGYVDDGRTAAALNHQFRPIKKEAEKMRARAGTNLPLSHGYCSHVAAIIYSFLPSFFSFFPPITNHSSFD